MINSSVRSRALILRLKGLSYNEITKQLGVAKSTLRTWLGHVVLSDSAQKRLKGRVRQGVLNGLIRRNKLQTHHARERARRANAEGQNALARVPFRDLAYVGAALYWAEGYKRLKIRDGRERVGHAISFVNADPEMIRTFILFSRTVLGFSDHEIRLNMRLYPHINETAALKFWMQVTELPQERFFKTSYLVSGSSKGHRPYNRLPWGTLHIEICNTSKFHYLLGLIEGVKKDLLHGTFKHLPR